MTTPAQSPSPPSPHRDLPAPYVSPWRQLAQALTGVLAASGLKARELWRLNSWGELPVPPFWPRGLAALFWPAVLAALLVALPWIGWSLTSRSAATRAGEVAMVPADSTDEPLFTDGRAGRLDGVAGDPAPGSLVWAPDGRPPDGRPPDGLDADRTAGGRSGNSRSKRPTPSPRLEPSPAGVETREPSSDEPAQLPLASGRSSPLDAGAPGGIGGPASGSPVGAPAASPAPPADDPLALFRTVSPDGPLLDGRADPHGDALVLVVGAGFDQAAERRRQAWADQWLEIARQQGYRTLTLVDGAGRRLGDAARVGSGMILLQPFSDSR